MKVIIAGSRTITDMAILVQAISDSGFAITEVVSGGASGVDTLGEQWADENGVGVRLFRADWDRHGKAAGPIRNCQMAGYADALITLWDGKSRGTQDMIYQARLKGLKVFGVVVRGGGDR